ncbi:ATP-binding protein [Candidatus Gribaldobacteria bacterium]|nr:ATP-binding protein [Candidatus Gribaldobacteria bacterium]
MQIYPRKILPAIEKTLKIPEIIVIHGARQTGKTTLLGLIKDKLALQNNPQNIVFFDLEDFELTDLCNKGVPAVVEHLKAINCDFKKKIYLFIDEIQYLENPSSFLKYFFDHFKDKIKIIVSGSSSFAIKSKFKESLVGRTLNFELFGLDFEEFLIFKNVSFDLQTKDALVLKKLKELFKEFIFFGTYPRIVLEKSLELKEKLLKQIIDTYLKKDIRDLAKISDIAKFNKLLKVLASQSGNLINILELANTVGIARPTLDNYLSILENTYVIKLLTPFSGNKRSEISKMPKIFFEDLGLKNILEEGRFAKTILGNDLEAACFSILRKRCGVEGLHFWRTTQKEEIDFVLQKRQGLFAFEVKTNARNKDRLMLDRFKKLYPKTSIYLVGLDFIDKTKSKGLNFIYPWQLC